MSALSKAILLLLIAAPSAIFVALLHRTGAADGPSASPRAAWKRAGTLAGTVALGAIFFVPAWLVEERLQAWSGLDAHARITSDLAALVYALFVAAPLEQGVKVAAVWPVRRSRYFAAPIDGIVYASAAALGFASAHNVELLWGKPIAGIDVARALLAVPAHLFFAATWGYALGREAQHGAPMRLGGRAFNWAWLFAMLFNGIYDHIVFGRGPTALIATAPILLGMALIGLLATRDLLRRGAIRRGAVRRFLPAIAPPSIEEVRAALRRTERPVTLSWIGFGALVTTGVMTASLAGAVALGHRIGVDFAAVDRGGTSAEAAAPLVLLGAAALSAFPVAGYLVARASSARSVIEPAISAALAIAGALVLLGLAAPVAVVFALAFAPIAFGLACAGAWMGITR